METKKGSFYSRNLFIFFCQLYEVFFSFSSSIRSAIGIESLYTFIYATINLLVLSNCTTSVFFNETLVFHAETFSLPSHWHSLSHSCRFSLLEKFVAYSIITLDLIIVHALQLGSFISKLVSMIFFSKIFLCNDYAYD